MNIEDCFKKELLIRKKPSQEKAKQSLKSAKIYIKKAKDNITLKNYDITIVASQPATGFLTLSYPMVSIISILGTRTIGLASTRLNYTHSSTSPLSLIYSLKTIINSD
jgi:hypothetical protein